MIGGFKFRIGGYTAVCLGCSLLSILATLTIYQSRGTDDDGEARTNIQHLLFLTLISLVDGNGAVLLLVFGGGASYRFHYRQMARLWRRLCVNTKRGGEDDEGGRDAFSYDSEPPESIYF